MPRKPKGSFPLPSPLLSLFGMGRAQQQEGQGSMSKEQLVAAVEGSGLTDTNMRGGGMGKEQVGAAVEVSGLTNTTNMRREKGEGGVGCKRGGRVGIGLAVRAGGMQGGKCRVRICGESGLHAGREMQRERGYVPNYSAAGCAVPVLRPREAQLLLRLERSHHTQAACARGLAERPPLPVSVLGAARAALQHALVDWQHALVDWQHALVDWQHALVDWQHALVDWQHALVDWQHALVDWQYALVDWQHALVDWQHALVDWQHALVDWQHALVDWQHALVDWQHALVDWQHALVDWQHALVDWQHALVDWQHALVDWQHALVDWQHALVDWQYALVDWQHALVDWQHALVDWQHALVDWQRRRYSLTPAGVAAAQMCMERAGLQTGAWGRGESGRGVSGRGVSGRGVSGRGVSGRGASRRGVSGRGVSRQRDEWGEGCSTILYRSATLHHRSAIRPSTSSYASIESTRSPGRPEDCHNSSAAPHLFPSQFALLPPLPTYRPSLSTFPPSSTPTCLSLAETTDIRLPPLSAGQRFCHAYRVVLLIDSREKGAAQLTEFLTRVEKLPAQVAALPVGDALWVAQPLTLPTSSAAPPSTSSSSPPSSVPPSSSSADPPSALPASSALPALPGTLFCLEWVAERKRVDDLWQSIKSKRFKDQKLRIKHCGLRRPIYVVEGNLDASNGAESLRTASVQTLVHDGFDVHHTTCIAHTRRHYAHLTRAITDICNRLSTAPHHTSSSQMPHSPALHAPSSSPTPRDCCVTFDQFLDDCRSSQALSVGDVFGHMLLQVRGLTVDMATAILRRYPSLPVLHAAYTFLEGNREAQERLLCGVNVKGKAPNYSAAEAAVPVLRPRGAQLLLRLERSHHAQATCARGLAERPPLPVSVLGAARPALYSLTPAGMAAAQMCMERAGLQAGEWGE
ncbi:unnamed protein product [Closterium sp. NIES-65]|nr:unnamed protein product [Closterium sp. NIES-65]